ncbi:hypothetical protein PVAG01_00293 [Phlyctema vagabunda]|uniref:Zn(2)-C6 fungal-type domain-containing protein n=1 Tax=Phlyctema vagabunda TaxID=108571 RepID=A0ABR4PTU9_9HELO
MPGSNTNQKAVDAPAATSLERKVKRRVSRPKVKTGCDNCKNRRVKCDETRPQCAKCVKAGRQCSGYPAYNPRREGVRIAPPVIRPRDTSMSNGNLAASSISSSSGSSSSPSPPSLRQLTTTLVHKPRRKPVARPASPPTSTTKFSLLNLAPSIGYVDDPQEGLYFRLFREHTANELSGFFDSKFWTRSVLQESHSEASIRHAVVALGALYKTLEKASESPPGSPDNNATVDTAANHYNFALQQYGKSLTRLREALESQETRSNRTVLISIVLFTCFQSFIGDHKGAIQQIQSGLGLLDARRAQRFLPMAQQQADTIEDELVQMFTRLAVQAKSYDMAFHFPHPYVIRLTPSNPPTSPSEPSSPSGASTASVEHTIPEVFESLHDARTALDSLCERIMRFNEALSTYYGGPNNILPASIRSSGAAFRASLDNWSAAFEPLLESRRNIGVTNTHRAGINVLKMLQLMSAVLFWTAFSLSEMNFDNFIGDFRAVVELAKEIVVDEELSLAAKRCGSLTDCQHRQRAHDLNDNHGIPGPFLDEDNYSHIKASFALDLGIVPPLFVVATKCRDRKLRREAIRLLMSSPRREGMWDSILSGRAAMWIMEIEEEGLPPFDPWNSTVAGQIAGDAVPLEERRVMVKEILFDLQKRNATLRCGTRGLKDQREMDARARETYIEW